MSYITASGYGYREGSKALGVFVEPKHSMLARAYVQRGGINVVFNSCSKTFNNRGFDTAMLFENNNFGAGCDHIGLSFAGFDKNWQFDPTTRTLGMRGFSGDFQCFFSDTKVEVLTPAEAIGTAYAYAEPIRQFGEEIDLSSWTERGLEVAVVGARPTFGYMERRSGGELWREVDIGILPLRPLFPEMDAFIRFLRHKLGRPPVYADALSSWGQSVIVDYVTELFKSGNTRFLANFAMSVEEHLEALSLSARTFTGGVNESELAEIMPTVKGRDFFASILGMACAELANQTGRRLQKSRLVVAGEISPALWDRQCPITEKKTFRCWANQMRPDIVGQNAWPDLTEIDWKKRISTLVEGPLGNPLQNFNPTEPAQFFANNSERTYPYSKLAALGACYAALRSANATE